MGVEEEMGGREGRDGRGEEEMRGGERGWRGQDALAFLNVH